VERKKRGKITHFLAHTKISYILFFDFQVYFVFLGFYLRKNGTKEGLQFGSEKKVTWIRCESKSLSHDADYLHFVRP
jgi:hypothetical protein